MSLPGCSGRRRPPALRWWSWGRGNSSAHFTYRVVAKRKGYEQTRLAPMADHVVAKAKAALQPDKPQNPGRHQTVTAPFNKIATSCRGRP